MTMEATSAPTARAVPAPGWWRRYRSFLVSTNVLVTAANFVLLVAGFVASLLHAGAAANVLWAAAALVGGAPIFVLAARGIVQRDLTAGVMVSVAMIAALLIGEYSAAALVAFMMMFGDLLESFTVARANNALRDLAALLPAEATLLRDGRPVSVAITAVRPGDRLLVRNGERIPVDGTVAAGQAAIDQSAITGESVPVDKAPGDGVFAGTINTAGTLEVSAEKVGRDTTLGTIVKLVEDAQRTQAPVQRLANRYAQYLVPITFAIAVIVYLATGEIVRSVTVLVVVCPCSLVLATPTALVAAIGNAARHNAVVRSGAALEALGRVRLVAFDKTGTLTLGRPQVAQVVALNGLAPAEVLALAASVERYSEHPLGRAIVAAAGAAGEPPAAGVGDVQTLTGFGVSGLVNGRQIVVGSVPLLVSLGIAVPDQCATLQALGYTVIPVATSGEVVGLIALSDTVRPESAAAVSALHKAGAKTVLISGDQPAAVGAAAEQLGVDEFHAGVLPQDKLALIRELQTTSPVAYVGDGVNDAPALAAANVGIAMAAAGADVAIETADIALMTDDLQKLPHLLSLAKAALRTIRVSVAFSMSMNLLALILSTLGIIGPPAGAVMHELSALPVLAFAARLVAYKSE